MQGFVHLHVHTYYSILDGMSPIPRLVEKAAGNGMRGLAVTDHGNMFGIKELFDCCADLNKKTQGGGTRATETYSGVRDVCGKEQGGEEQG